jgi:hypothetical protein
MIPELLIRMSRLPNLAPIDLSSLRLGPLVTSHSTPGSFSSLATASHQICSAAAAT